MDSITLVIPKNRYNYYQYLLFLSKLQTIYNFSVISENDNGQVDTDLIKTKYVVVMKKYCYVDFKKLALLIKNKNCKILASDNGNILFCETRIIRNTKISIEEILKNPTVKLSDKKHDISKYSYLSNMQIIGCDYHKAIFVCLDDNDINFDKWLNEFHDKVKNIYHKGKNYNLKIGKTFFIKNFIHIGILPDGTVYWDDNKGRWISANKKIMNLFHKKNRRVSL